MKTTWLPRSGGSADRRMICFGFLPRRRYAFLAAVLRALAMILLPSPS